MCYSAVRERRRTSWVCKRREDNEDEEKERKDNVGERSKKIVRRSKNGKIAL